MTSGSKVGVVVVAAGQSTRMGGVDKTFVPVLGKPLVVHTLSCFEASPLVGEVALVLADEEVGRGKQLVQEHHLGKVSHVCHGGQRRQDSVLNGLQTLQPCQWVMVHDGARPCLDQQLLERGMEAVQETGAAVAGVPVKDTIKMVSPHQVVQDTPPRDTLWAAQTPQIFRYDLLLEAHHNCTQTVTDDAAMVEILGHSVKMFLGSHKNIKVTTPEDLAVVEVLLGRERGIA